MNGKIIFSSMLLMSAFGQSIATAEDIYKSLFNPDQLQELVESYTDAEEIKKDLDDDKNYEGMTALELAVYYGEPESVIKVVTLLLEYGAQAKTHPVVIYALEKHHNIELAKLLLQDGQGNNITNLSGDTPITWALKNNKTEYFSLLIKYHQGNINELVIGNDSILKYAIENGDNELIKFLIKTGVDVNKADKTFGEMTPLKTAILANQQKTVELLLKKGALLWHKVPKNTLLLEWYAGKFMDVKAVMGKLEMIISMDELFWGGTQGTRLVIAPEEFIDY